MPIPVPKLPSMDDRIGQLMMIGFEGMKAGDAGVEHVRKLISDGKIGGVILMGNNIKDPEQVKKLNAYLQGAAPKDKPLLIATDMEGGKVSRLDPKKGFKSFPSAEQVAAGSLDAAKKIYGDMAGYMKSLGFNMNFGPVLDSHVNGNPIIADHGRSYGADPQKIAAFGDAFVTAFADKNMLAVPKHWPGHGRTIGQDSHVQHASLKPDLAATQRDLQPFKALMHKSPLIMSGHIHNPDLSKDGRPASLSAQALLGHLRSKDGYKGVIISDDLNMKGAQGFGEPHEAALRAGNNLLLNALLYNPGARMAELKNAAFKDPIMAGRVNDSYHRVMALKDLLKAPDPAATTKAAPPAKETKLADATPPTKGFAPKG